MSDLLDTSPTESPGWSGHQLPSSAAGAPDSSSHPSSLKETLQKLGELQSFIFREFRSISEASLATTFLPQSTLACNGTGNASSDGNPVMKVLCASEGVIDMLTSCGRYETDEPSVGPRGSTLMIPGTEIAADKAIIAGITMPTPVAQAALIRDTYAALGSISPILLTDHSTSRHMAQQSGTPTGDLVEAEAIHTAFYGFQSGVQRAPEDQELLIGSIKTMITYTEGSAGLASLLKASLALQHGEIVPNLHLDRLNPALNLTQGPESKQGAMMAAGMTFDDAQELCRLDDYNGRWSVAASNSSNSVTLSGDVDAIEEAEEPIAALTSPDVATSALSEKGPYHQVLEVGSRPSLKGPVIQTIEEVAGEKIQYFSCFNRDRNSVEALAEGLGQFWADQASDVLNLDEYESCLSGVTGNRLVKNLANYQWDHERTFYHESRISKARRTHPQPSHELLGTKQPDNCSQDIRWRNLLNLREVPWLKDHQVQSQPVYPGAGYVATTLEAIQVSLQDANISIIEIRDFVIGWALIIEDDHMVEILNASCDIQVQFGELDAEALPSGSVMENHIFDLEESRFYNAVSRLGYGYTGAFRALSDTSLRTIQLPTGIDCIRFNVPLCASTVPGSMVPFRSSVKPGESGDINGDVEIYRDDGDTTIVQLQGLHTKPLTVAVDLDIFSAFQWGVECLTSGNLSIPEGKLKGEKKLSTPSSE
ncbi:MAG: hypothetical protein Q9178_007273 [Gyalolechia marmorata]